MTLKPRSGCRYCCGAFTCSKRIIDAESGKTWLCTRSELHRDDMHVACGVDRYLNMVHQLAMCEFDKALPIVVDNET